MSVKGILAAAAVLIASLVSAGITRPAFAVGGAPGSIDTSFGINGTAVTDLGAAGGTKLGGPTAAIVLGNGDILVGGTQGVVRLLSTGSLDTTFGSGGFAAVGLPPGGALPGLTVQPDGKIIWSGGVTNTSGGGNLSDFAVERFTANGTPDNTFGRNGLVTTDMPIAGGGSESFSAAVVQPDGKIVAGGSVSTAGRKGHANVVLARYNPDGTPDTSFGSGGTVVGGPGEAQALGLDAAGDIFTLDRFTVPGEAEFSPAGVQDAQVTAAPITTSSPSPVDENNGPLAFLPTGQTLAGGSVFVSGSARLQDDDAQVQRLNADGTVDAAFASPPIDYGGQQGLNIHDTVDSLAVQPDGKILVGGGAGLARINPDGTLDTTFGTGGTELAVPAPATLLAGLTDATLLAVLPDGEFLAIGTALDPTTLGTSALILTRYFQ